MPEILVCEAGALPDGATRIVYDGKLEIGVTCQSGKYFAYRNFCPHQGGPACEGLKMPAVKQLIDADGLHVGQEFDDGDIRIVCPWHGYEFHLSTGVNVIDPKLRLKKFEIVEKAGKVYVKT